MLQLFRTNQIVTSIFFLLYLAVLRLLVFFVPQPVSPVTHGVLSAWVWPWVQMLPTAGVYVLSCLLIFLQAVYLNSMLLRFRMDKELTLIPGLFVCIVSSTSAFFIPFSDLLVANLFLVIALGEIWKTYKASEATVSIFNSGLWLGVSGLFCTGYLVFMPMLFVGLLQLRAYSFKERLAIIFGVFASLFLCWVVFFVNDSNAFFWKNGWYNQVGFLSFGSGIPDPLGWVEVVLMVLLLLASLYYYITYANRRTIDVVKRMNIMYWGLLLSMFYVVFQKESFFGQLLVLTPFVGLATGLLAANMPKKYAEILHMSLLVVILMLQYRWLWLPG